jgi:hypothetical protein
MSRSIMHYRFACLIVLICGFQVVNAQSSLKIAKLKYGGGGIGMLIRHRCQT